jgi:hypothetical protein
MGHRRGAGSDGERRLTEAPDVRQALEELVRTLEDDGGFGFEIHAAGIRSGNIDPGDQPFAALRKARIALGMKPLPKFKGKTP